MKILVVAGDVPATTAMPGSPRLFNLCRELSRSHDLLLATMCSSADRRRMFVEDATAAGVYRRILALPERSLESPTWWSLQQHRLRLQTGMVTRYLYPEYYRRVCDTIREVIEKE